TRGAALRAPVRRGPHDQGGPEPAAAAAGNRADGVDARESLARDAIGDRDRPPLVEADIEGVLRSGGNRLGKRPLPQSVPRTPPLNRPLSRSAGRPVDPRTPGLLGGQRRRVAPLPDLQPRRAGLVATWQ